MFKGVWVGSNIVSKERVLILGESHYSKKETALSSFETRSVVVDHIDYRSNKQVGIHYFNRITESFGYYKNDTEKFFNRVMFGNYVESLCGIGDSQAKNLIAKHRTDYNNSLFNFVNDQKVDVIICFSKSVYNALPGLNGENPEGSTVVYRKKPRQFADKCMYNSEISHPNCDVTLNKKLKVIGLNHASRASKYDLDLHREYIKQLNLEVFNNTKI